MNFTARSLDKEFVAGIGSRYLIDDLHLRLDDAAMKWSLPLRNADGSVLGNVAWTPPKPGFALANASLAPLSLSFLAFLVLSRLVASSATASARQLVEREQESATLARTDYQTSLPNRLAFNERFEQVQQTDATVALLFTDLNGFKQINDTKGHATGDALIVGLAKRIEEMIVDDLFYARMGGDEFSFIFIGDDAEERFLSRWRAFPHLNGDGLFRLEKRRDTSVERIDPPGRYSDVFLKSVKFCHFGEV